MDTGIDKWIIGAQGKIHGPGGTAELLGVNPTTLRTRMDQLGIRYRRRERGPTDRGSQGPDEADPELG
jgi:hypothetical protein